MYASVINGTRVPKSSMIGIRLLLTVWIGHVTYVPIHVIAYSPVYIRRLGPKLNRLAHDIAYAFVDSSRFILVIQVACILCNSMRQFMTCNINGRDTASDG